MTEPVAEAPEEAGDDAPYRIAIKPVRGRLQALAGDFVLADSRHALVLHETRLPPSFYFPSDDVARERLSANPRQTFCPFKGNAIHYDVRLDDGTVPAAAWSYVEPQEDGRGIGDMIAFYSHVLDGWRLDGKPFTPPPADGRAPSGPLVQWLLLGAMWAEDSATLTRQLAEQLLAIGMPVWRINVSLWTLHPQLAGRSYTWRRSSGEVTVGSMPHGTLQRDIYINSPVRLVSEGLGGVRQRLDTESARFGFPIMRELQARGATDYVAMPLFFADGQINTITLTTDHSDGFTTAQLGQTFEILGPLARFYEVHAARQNTGTLMRTYVGRRSADSVLDGRIQRGDGEDINAVVWFCDLRDSTELADRLPRAEFLALLNRFFDAAATPVLANGGEVLKFIGDAVLAIFPVEAGPRSACQAAMRAARATLADLESVADGNGAHRLRCALSLHLGTLTYGNIGTDDRLDFTVVGATANEAVRLSEAAKTLDLPLLASGRFAEAAEEPLHPLGPRRLRGVQSTLEVYTLPELAANEAVSAP